MAHRPNFRRSGLCDSGQGLAMRPSAARPSLPHVNELESVESSYSSASHISRTLAGVDARYQVPGAVATQQRTTGRNLDSLGLILLHEPQQRPIADLIFIHAPGAHSHQTWMKDDSPASFWPLEWLPFEQTLSATRISIFGYSLQAPSPSAQESLDFSGWAKELLLNLRFKTGREEQSLDVGTVPVIFVSHGLGGLVAKKAYLLGSDNTNADFTDITRAVAAFVFLSTPHRGVHLADVLRNVLAACNPEWSSTLLPSHLERHSQMLHNINVHFKELVPYVDTISFYETQPTLIGTTEVVVLRKERATMEHQNEKPIPLAANHVSITKYGSSQDPNYQRVRDVLIYLVGKFKSDSLPSPPDNSPVEKARVSSFLGIDEAPEDDHSYFADKRVDGTCEYILEHEAFSSWLSDNSMKLGVLWCHGKAGSGKSVTASHVIEYLTEENLPRAFYYFRSGDQVKNNLTLFLLSIAFQITTFNAEYRRKVCKLADGGFNIGKAGYKLLWKKLFTSTLLTTQFKEPLYLVIDGLDELDMAMAKEFISKLFVELSEISQPLRLLLVSRPTPEIDAAVDRLARHLRPSSALKKMALDDNEEDLELYVREEMQSMHGEDSFKEETIKQVLRKADGNFLWVHLVVREILECNTENDVETALRTVPRELNPLYLRIDQRLADVFRHRPNDKQLGETILMWASCSRYPLLLEELNEALNPEFSKILDIRQTVQRVCGEFVVVDKRSHLSMMHASAREFLLSNSDLNYYINPEKAHQSLFRKCIDKLKACQPHLRQIIANPRSFVKYAAESWPFHLSSSGGWLDQDSLSILVDLFQDSAVLDWMCVVAASGRLRVLVDASKALTAFIKVVDSNDRDRSPLEHRITDKEYILSWAHDLVRVVGKFGGQMIDHPKAVYALIPPFCPRSSAIHQQFATDLFGASLKVRGSLSKDWDDCLAKFAVPGASLPHKLVALERHFAILTRDGIVRLYYSNTCEEARNFVHGEPVLAMCFNAHGDRLATCGLDKTKIWDVRTARHLFTVENPRHQKALALSFRNQDEQGEELIMLSDDSLLRCCSMSAAYFSWKVLGHCADDSDSLQQSNSPRNAQFSSDGLQVAISYRGTHPAVWSLEQSTPRLVSHCERRAMSSQGYRVSHSNYSGAQDFCWNPASGHVLGFYNDGCVFKWHPATQEYEMSDIKSNSIKCNADGKLFVTSSGDGSFRIWDFDHFEPIYHLSSPGGIRDIDIDRNEARIYDIRDEYCTAWQPNALLRMLESDDKASDTKSSHDSSNQLSLASEGQTETTDLVTALSPYGSDDSYVVGDDVGLAQLFTFDGELISTLADGVMSIEHIACSRNGNMVAVADLGLSVIVRETIEDGEYVRRAVDRTPLLKINSSDNIRQLLFDIEGKSLLIVTESALKVYNLATKALVGIAPEHRNYYWINHPNDPLLLFGFGADNVRVIPWQNMADASTYTYDRPTDPTTTPFLRNDSRRPSEAYPFSPSESDATTKKVLVSPDHRYFLVEIQRSTQQAIHRKDFLLIELEHINQARDSLHFPIRSMPQLSKDIHVGLGFIAIDDTALPASQSRRSSVPTVIAARRPVPRSQYMEQTLAYINRKFWVCSINIGPDDGRNAQPRKHFPLPRDWHNAEWLGLATIKTDGTLLCPRNGGIAVVSNGLTYEWTDD